MNLKVGEFYLSSGGEIIEINFLNKYNMFEDINNNCYFLNGKCDGDARDFDLIAHIPKELHRYIILKIQEYHTNENSRKSIDKYKTRILSNDRN